MDNEIRSHSLLWIALIPWTFDTSKVARLESKISNLGMAPVGHTDEKILADWERKIQQK